MAEGIEEAETNSSSGAGDATTSMLSAAMPCEVHEFETYHHQAIKRSVSTSPTPKIMPLISQSLRKVQDQQQQPSNDFEPMSQYLQQQHRLHQQRKSIATKRKHSTDERDEECPKQQPQQQQQQQQQLHIVSQHDDDQLSQSSCSSLAPLSPPLRKLKAEVPNALCQSICRCCWLFSPLSFIKLNHFIEQIVLIRFQQLI